MIIKIMNLVQVKPLRPYSLLLNPPQMEIMEFTVYIMGVLGVQCAAKQLGGKRKANPSEECS
jgi:hypothetical protein